MFKKTKEKDKVKGKKAKKAKKGMVAEEIITEAQEVKEEIAAEEIIAEAEEVKEEIAAEEIIAEAEGAKEEALAEIKPVKEKTTQAPSKIIVVENNNSKDGLCTAALVLGIIAFFINPLYILSILAIIFGAIGSGKNSSKKGSARVGIVLGIISLIIQFSLDLVITIFTFGMGGISFCC